MGTIDKRTLNTVQGVIAKVEAARQAVIDFENEYADLITQYHRLYDAMNAAEEEYCSLVSSLTMLDEGEKASFGNGWGARRDSKRELDPAIILEHAYDFVKANPDLVKFSVVELEKAVTHARNGVRLPPEVFEKAVKVVPGTIRALMPKFK